MNASPKDTLWDLIKATRFAMLVHRHPDGMLHAAPMTTQNKTLDESATLYFFVSQSSELVTCLQADAHVNLSYANPDRDSYVSVAGQGRVVQDRALAEALWNPMVKAWFPKGLDDPDLALLAVRIVHAEYWDVKESKMVQLLKMAKAAVMGEPPRSLGEHKNIDFGTVA